MKIEKRKTHILNTAIAILIEEGYQAFSMTSVARRAGASKETLYKYFGNKQGFITAIIEHKSNQADIFKPYHSLYPKDIGACLQHFGKDLLRLILSDSSIAINRMVISVSNKDASFAQLLEQYGKKPIKAHITEQLSYYHSSLAEEVRTQLHIFFALLIQDTQLNAIYGLINDLSEINIKQRAYQATEQYLQLIKKT